MAKCVNCNNDARYVHKVTPNPRTDTYYCPSDLPRFLYPQMKAGLLNIPVEEVPVVKTETSKKKKKEEAVVEVEETPVVEPTTEAEPAIVE